MRANCSPKATPLEIFKAVVYFFVWMLKTYRYRIYPSKSQARAIDEAIEKCRELYNKLLALKKCVYKKEGTNLSRKDLYKIVKGDKEIYSQVSQNVANRIDKAYRNFFARVKRGEKEKGFPKFKKYGVYRSITLPQVINPEYAGKKAYFPKIGWLNVKYHRSTEGTPKTLTIKKAKSGKYFITVCCDAVPKETIETGNGEVGLDLGLNHFIVTSDGEFFDHPKPMKKLSEKRKLLARRFSKTKKKSSNRNKAKIKLAKIDERMANARNDFGWNACIALIKKYSTSYVENLNVRSMVKNRRFAGAIMDVSWSDFTQKLCFKAESAGGKVVKVNPKNTSQLCSECGRIAKKALSIRTHACPYCGLELDRDLNAARNIPVRGIGLERPNFKPVGVEVSVDGASPKQASPMNQEVHCFSRG